MSSSSSAAAAAASMAKSLTPPTIANAGSHQRVLGFLQSLQVDAVEDKDTNIATMPQRLQEYTTQHSLRPSSHLVNLQRTTEGLERAVMAGSPDEANFLCLLLELLNAKRVVEVGVFRGLTTLAMAECLQALMMMSADKDDENRTIYGLDVSADYAAVGMEAWKAAGVQDLIDFRVGDAKDTMASLLTELGKDTVDLCFIDADKQSYDAYYEMALQLVRPGGLIVVDNTLWGGSVVAPDGVLQKAVEKAAAQPDDENAQRIASRMKDTIAVKAINAKISQDERIQRVSFLTIADGVTICRKK